MLRRKKKKDGLNWLGRKPSEPYLLGPGTRDGKLVEIHEKYPQDTSAPSHKRYIQPKDPETGKYISIKEARKIGLRIKKNPNYRPSSSKK